MNRELLSARSRAVENALEQRDLNLGKFLQFEKNAKLESSGLPPSLYQLFAVRQNDSVGPEIFEPINVGSYGEAELYGALGSSLFAFRRAVRNLAEKARSISGLDPCELEYFHQVTLFWADVGRLKEFLGSSLVLSEIVSEFQTIRFQYLGRDTPKAIVEAMARALEAIVSAKKLSVDLVDTLVGILEERGYDSLVVDSLRDSDE